MAPSTAAITKMSAMTHSPFRFAYSARMETRPRSFMPPSRDDQNAAWRRSFVRTATATALSRIKKEMGSPERILREAWPHDRNADLIVRSPSGPPTSVGDFPGAAVAKLMLLAPRSAAAQLFALAMSVDLKGVAQFTFPLPTNFAAAVFVGEGQPISVRQGSFAGMTVGPLRKLALLAGMSNELEFASGGIAETVIAYTLEVAVGRGLDAVLLSANVATAVAPAGLFFGVAPITATAGGGITAMATDLRNLVEAIATAGIDTASVVFLTAPSESMALALLSGPHFNFKIITSNSVPAATLIAIATAALVFAGDGGNPSIDTSSQTTLNFAEPAAALVDLGGTVASPQQSTFQTDSLALRCTSYITWAAAPGAVQFCTGTTW
jgi:hypothetical protein